MVNRADQLGATAQLVELSLVARQDDAHSLGDLPGHVGPVLRRGAPVVDQGPVRA